MALAADTAPAVRLAELRVGEAEARVRQARGALLPTVAGSAGALHRSYNRHSLGLGIPTIPGQEPFPDRIGPQRVRPATADRRNGRSGSMLTCVRWVLRRAPAQKRHLVVRWRRAR